MRAADTPSSLGRALQSLPRALRCPRCTPRGAAHTRRLTQARQSPALPAMWSTRSTATLNQSMRCQLPSRLPIYAGHTAIVRDTSPFTNFHTIPSCHPISDFMNHQLRPRHAIYVVLLNSGDVEGIVRRNPSCSRHCQRLFPCFACLYVFKAFEHT